jgi:hypothetical protein
LDAWHTVSPLLSSLDPVLTALFTPFDSWRIDVQVRSHDRLSRHSRHVDLKLLHLPVAVHFKRNLTRLDGA